MEIKKKLKLDNPIIIVGKDCPRQDIWRMKYLSSYKANRVYDDSFLGGPFFKMAYNDNLFIKGGANKIMKYWSSGFASGLGRKISFQPMRALHFVDFDGL